jgi:hypothetical protein
LSKKTVKQSWPATCGGREASVSPAGISETGI